MRFSLWAVGSLLVTSQALPHTTFTLSSQANYTLPLPSRASSQAVYGPTSKANPYSTLIEARDGQDVPVFQMATRPNTGWANTMFARIPEHQSGGWYRSTVRDIAREGHEQLVTAFPGEVSLVAALYVPSEGIWLGSIPHGNGPGGVSAQDYFATRCLVDAPRLWREIRGRTRVGAYTGSLWHAEDAALLYFEETRGIGRIRGDYPDFSFIAVYGQRFDNDPVGFQDLCVRNLGRAGGVEPDCFDVARELDIRHGV